MKTTEQRPLILISNDDGYHAPGLRFLADFLRPFAHVLICAPDGGRSGFSRAFSAVDPLTLRRRKNLDDLWHEFMRYDIRMYNRARHGIVGTFTNFRGPVGERVTIAIYHGAQKLMKFN
jgi:5'/3'-nucleotidase SurE